MALDVLEQVALVTGRILHIGTGEPVVGRIRITADEGLIIDKVFADGTFVLSGYIDQLFPKLDEQDYLLTLTIRAESAQFWEGYAEVQQIVTINSNETFEEPLPIDPGGNPIYFPESLPDPVDPDEPDPLNMRVNIRGRVVEAANPEAPIVNATVEVLDGLDVPRSTITNGEGRYRLIRLNGTSQGITVIAPAEIRCSATGFWRATPSLVGGFWQAN